MSFTRKTSNRYHVLAMAFNRYSWVEKARNRLVGALGEYAKIKYAKVAGIAFDWEPEVMSLLAKVEELFDKNKVKLKGKFDLDKAFQEAVREAASEQQQIVDAKNAFITDYIKKPEQAVKFLHEARKLDLKSEDLLTEMLRTLKPDLARKAGL